MSGTPIPVINPIQSVLAWKVGAFARFQMAATNTPTSWTCTALPPGITLDSTTGLVSGVPTQATAPTDLVVTATNGGGTSAPVLFAIGVEDSDVVPGGTTEVDYDWDTGTVTSTLSATALEATSTTSTTAAQPSPPMIYGVVANPVLFGKTGDYLLLNVAIQKSAVNQDLDVDSILVSVKGSADDAAAIELNDGTFVKLGSGASALYQVLLYLDPDKLAVLFGSDGENYNGGNQTVSNEIVFAFAEIKAATLQSWSGGSPQSVPRTSRTFCFAIEQRLN